MKLYHNQHAPNAARVRFAAAELGIALDLIDIDLMSAEQRSADYLQKVPSGLVPALETDCGSIISESISICRYLAAITKDKTLFGDEPLRRAEIDMWDRRIEFEIYLPIANTVRHTVPYMAAMEKQQMPDWGAYQRATAERRLLELDQTMANKAFIAGDNFTMADITAYCAIRFFRAAKGSIGPDTHPNLWEWFNRIKARPGAKA